MRIYYDTEFIEDGRTIDLISIGMVSETGDEFYAVSSEFDRVAVQKRPWLMQHVWPHLPITKTGALDLLHYDVLSRSAIRDEVRNFVLAYPDPELWAYYGAYDHIALCQLFGPMIDLPDGFPMFTNDLMTRVRQLGNPKLPRQSAATEHHALWDARWDKAIGEYLDQYEASQRT